MMHNSRWSATRSMFVWGGLVLLAACASTETPTPDDPNVPEGCNSLQEFKAKYVYTDPQGVYIVNGDTPITSDRGLQDFYSVTCGLEKDSLIVNQVNGKDDKWSETQVMNLTYCVGNTFNATQRAQVVKAFDEATAAWEGAGKVNFIHLTAEDANCTAQNKKVVFDVNLVNANGQYLARAFFPSSPRSQRNVLVDKSSFEPLGVWTLKGIMIHELGHTLGFRHEHTRPESGKCFEDKNWRGLTTYDSSSVMHYPQCNGTQKGDLSITDKDVEGIVALYGAPDGTGGSGGGTGGTGGDGGTGGTGGDGGSGGDGGTAGSGGDGGTGGTAGSGGGTSGDSCVSHCGTQAPAGCWCDNQCAKIGDCCADKADACGSEVPPNSCEGRCGSKAPAGCWCDATCEKFGDCCDDKATACSGSSVRGN